MTTAKSKIPKTAWKPGQSGNPAGKPHGTRNRATQMVLAMMGDGAEEITKAVIDAARGGDLAAARLVIDRLAPPMRERPVSIDLPDTGTPEGIGKAQQAILQSVAGGDITPGEGTAISAIVEAHRRALETQELSARIAALEEKNGNVR
jgi:hypothetical protein